MITDTSLKTLLRAFQRPTNDHDASRLLHSATMLLTVLSNPLNITLLTSQLLVAPALWRDPDGLEIPRRVLIVINRASLQLLRKETDSPQKRLAVPAHKGFDRVEWARAVAGGADEKSAKWKHLLILGGLLIGFESDERKGLPQSLRSTLEASLVDAANDAMSTTESLHDIAIGSIVLVLGHTLSLLADEKKRRLRQDLLLPLLTQQLYSSRNGLNSGYFLGVADKDIIQLHGQQFHWSADSPGFYLVQKTAKSPLISALGLMSQLTKLCMEHVSDVPVLLRTVDKLQEFTRSLAIQWRQNKLSEVDQSEEIEYLDQETRDKPLPVLWTLLRSVMFSIIVSQQVLLSRVLGDRRIPMDKHAYIAIQTLHMLRNIYFISSRLGHHAFSQYTFLYMTCIDIITQYPTQAEAFLIDIRPKTTGNIPSHPLDRTLDLFFFNTAEHFALVLTPAANESLLLGPAEPYLKTGSDSRLLLLFEAAHSVVLAVLSAPQNAELAARRLPAYIATLMASFPSQLSARQFRLAVRTLVRIASPPNALSEREPLLASALLEMLYSRFTTAPEALLPLLRSDALSAGNDPESAMADPGLFEMLSEKAVMLLTIIDSLPALTLAGLDEWLPLVAAALPQITNAAIQSKCRARLWDVLSNGEMDVPRAALCVDWWNTQGGRYVVLGETPPAFSNPGSGIPSNYNSIHTTASTITTSATSQQQQQQQPYLMSGAIQPGDSKL